MDSPSRAPGPIEMERGQKRIVPKVLGGVLRHPRVLNETSEAQKTCATVLYRNQRQTQLKEKLQASTATGAEALASTVPHPSIVAVLDRPPVHSQSAAEAHRRQRLAMKELAQHQGAVGATASITSPTTSRLSTFLKAAPGGGKASTLVVGGVALLLTGMAIWPFMGGGAALAGEGAAAGTVMVTPSSAAAGGKGSRAAAAVTNTPESQQPLWLQRPRQG